MSFVTDLDSCEDFAKCGNQFFFQIVIKLGSTLREGIEKGIEDWLREGVEVLFKEEVALFFLFNGQKEPNIIFGYSFFQLWFRILIDSLMEEFTDGKPKAVRDKCSILFQVQIFGPFLDDIFGASIPSWFSWYFYCSSCLK